MTCKKHQEVARTIEGEGGVERNLNPLAGRTTEVTLIDKGHIGTRNGIVCCRRAEPFKVGFGHIDTHVVNRTTRAAAMQRDAVDEVVAVNAHLGQLLGCKNIAGVAVGV